MACDDLDKLRAESPQASPRDWPVDALNHLASCSRCAQLEDLLDSEPQPDFPEALRLKIENSILPGLSPVTPLSSVATLTIMLLLASMFVVIAAEWPLGLAGWRARNSYQIALNLSILLISSSMLANLLARLISPGSSSPVLPYSVVPLLALIGSNSLLFGYQSNETLTRQTLACWEIGVSCASVSVPLFWLILRRGFSINLVGQGAITGLLAGLTGVMVLEIHCPILEKSHIVAGHLGAALTSTVAGASLGYLYATQRLFLRKR